MRVLGTRRGSVITIFAALAAAATFAFPAAAAPASTAIMNIAVKAPASAGQHSGGKFDLVQFRGRQMRAGRYGGRRFGYGGARQRQWGNRRGYGYRQYGYGPAIVGGIASAIIGGSIVASQSGYGDAWQRCDNRYNSFRWSDGTFQPYGDGPRQLCPYLSR